MTALLIVISITLQATVLKFEKDLAWSSYRDLTSAEFSDKFKEYERAGYILIDSDAYETSGGLRYAMVWRENTDQRGWGAYRDMTNDEYHARWKEFKKKGYRPHDIESYLVNGKQRYAGIWVENKEKVSWSSERNLSTKEYGKYFKEQSAKGRRIVDVEAYSTGSGIRYAAIWIQNRAGVKWAQYHDLDRRAYQDRVDDYSKKGYLMVDCESYKIGNKQYYAAIWEKRSGYAIQVRTNCTALQYANLWREYRDKGYRLVDFERYETPGGDRYGGIWIENAARYHYNQKAALDNLVSQYKTANNLPGISVAVIKDGEMVYRRGFGHADTGAGKVAHGETVYLTASISKTIGGTIAAKLQQDGRLRNGRSVSLNLNNPTRSYLTNVRQSDGTQVSLPARHTHTLAQLFSHLACIEHYAGPEPSIQHYVRAIDALPQIWDAPFLSSCTIGTDRNYSTHAFTYIAAVLEQVTGSTSAQLVRSELAIPYGLPSLRALYTTSSVPANYERATPYLNNNTATSFSNNSWKIFGGGIEASAVDLASFGWQILDEKIVSAATRDNILWNRVNPNRNNGIAWDIRTRNGYRVAEHTGSWTGALSILRVYRDDGLVIAVLTNRGNHTSGSLRSLTSDIAGVVLP